jgi:FkbM family methyltransferase
MIQTLYRFLKATGLRGRGLLMRCVTTLHPRAKHFPLHIPGIGDIHANLRLGSVLPLFDYALGDLGHCAQLASCMTLFLKADGCLWDVGANIGTVSLHFAQARFGLKRIEVFEPNPELVANLRLIFANLPHVRINAVALGSESGQAKLHLQGTHDSSTASLVQEFAGEKQVLVPVTSGDTFWREFQAPIPSVIKIDVEGYEPQVFAGLRGLIATAQPVIFFEHLFLSNEQIESMIPDGYAWYLILDQGGLTQDLAKRDRSHDSMLIPQSRRHELPAEAVPQ